MAAGVPKPAAPSIKAPNNQAIMTTCTLRSELILVNPLRMTSTAPECLRVFNNKIAPYDIKLTRAEYLDEMYRALFVRVEESDQVMKANRMAREMFYRTSGPDYMPHLSLLYGDLEENVKKKILDDTGRIYNLMFQANHIYIFTTDGYVEDWQQIGKYALGG